MIVGIVLPLNRVEIKFVLIFGEDVVASRHNTDGSLFSILADVVSFVSVKVLDHAKVRTVDIFSQPNSEVYLSRDSYSICMFFSLFILRLRDLNELFFVLYFLLSEPDGFIRDTAQHLVLQLYKIHCFSQVGMIED